MTEQTSYLRNPEVQELALVIVEAVKLMAEQPRTDYPFAWEIAGEYAPRR
jgi:hypothetical protein